MVSRTIRYIGLLSVLVFTAILNFYAIIKFIKNSIYIEASYS